MRELHRTASDVVRSVVAATTAVTISSTGKKKKHKKNKKNKKKTKSQPPPPSAHVVVVSFIAHLRQNLNSLETRPLMLAGVMAVLVDTCDR